MQITQKELREKVGSAFCKLVSTSSAMELILLQKELRASPNDKDHLCFVLDELKKRQLETKK